MAVGGVRAVLTGGTGPLISVAVNQGAGKALEYVPQSLLRPIAEAGNYINRFIGDGGSSFLLSKDFTGVRTDESTATRRDSSATTFGITTLFGVALGPITVKARELLKGNPKVDGPDVVPPPSGRPSPRQSEIDAAANAGPGFAEQVIFKDGVRQTSRVPGSTVPDLFDCKTCTSIEIKNYDISRPGGISGLSSNVANQAKKRAGELPAGSVQQVIVDVRGQALSPGAEAKIISEIVRKSNGIIKKADVIIQR